MNELMFAQHGQARLKVRLAQDEETMQFVNGTQLFVVEPDQDIIDLDAGFRGGGAFLDGVDKDAGTLAQLMEASCPPTPM